MKNMSEMAKRIKERRKAMGFTQESFSEAADLSVSSYTKIENAFQNPSLEALMKIANHLELSLDYIVYGAEERKPSTVSDADVINAMLSYADSEKLLHAGEFLIRAAKIKMPQK